MSKPFKILVPGLLAAAIAAVPPGTVGQAAGPRAKYYDGVITVTTKGPDSNKWAFDETVTISGFKLEPWTVAPNQEHYETGKAVATAKIDDYNEDRSAHIFCDKTFPLSTGTFGISVVIDLPSRTYKLTVARATVPQVTMTSVAGTQTIDWVLLHWADPGDKNPLSADRVLRGEATGVLDGLPTKMTWVLSPHHK